MKCEENLLLICNSTMLFINISSLYSISLDKVPRFFRLSYTPFFFCYFFHWYWYYSILIYQYVWLLFILHFTSYCYLFYSSFDLASSPKVKPKLWPIRRVLLCNVPGIPRPNSLFLSQIKSSQETLAPQTYLREEWSQLYSPCSQAI